MLRVVLYAASTIVFAGLCTANDRMPPDCRAMAMTGPLNRNDYEDDAPGMPPPPPPHGILQNASIPGPGVSDVCPQLRGKDQCCSADYFRSAKDRLRGQTLLNGFSKQCQSRLDLFSSVAGGVVTCRNALLRRFWITVHPCGFVPRPVIRNSGWITSPLRSGDRIAGLGTTLDYQNGFIDDFTANFYRLQNIKTAMPPNIKGEIRTLLTFNILPRFDKFNSSGIIMWFVNRVVTEIVNAGNHANGSCISQQVQGALNQAAIAAVGRDLALLRNSSSTLFTISTLIRNITQTLMSRVPPAEQCIKGLLKLTCSKCQSAIPTLCRNVCGAMVKGCLAPYVAALNPQFNILWNVTSQLAQFLNATLSDLFVQQAFILNKTQLIQSVRAVCNVTTLANSFTGTVTLAKPAGIGHLLPQLARLLNTGLVSYALDGVALCDKVTAFSKCWNGSSEVAVDIPEFNVTSIPGQGKNPVMMFNETEMTILAQQLGTPISDIFKSENVSLVVPAAIMAPDGQTYQAPTATTGPTQTNAVCVTGVSIFVILAALLVSLF